MWETLGVMFGGCHPYPYPSNSGSLYTERVQLTWSEVCLRRRGSETEGRGERSVVSSELGPLRSVEGTGGLRSEWVGRSPSLVRSKRQPLLESDVSSPLTGPWKDSGPRGTPSSRLSKHGSPRPHLRRNRHPWSDGLSSDGGSALHPDDGGTSRLGSRLTPGNQGRCTKK